MVESEIETMSRKRERERGRTQRNVRFDLMVCVQSFTEAALRDYIVIIIIVLQRI